MSVSSDLVDRLAIHEVAERYFFGLDSHDHALLATCFAPDVSFEFNVAEPLVVRGRDALMAKIGVVARYKSTHSLGNMSVQLDGHRARSITHAIAHLLLDYAPGNPVLVRGLRYDDEWVRSGEPGEPRWCIARRIHKPLWQYQSVTSATALSARE